MHFICVTRSRDVAELHASMTFNPPKVNLQQIEHQCEHGNRKSICAKTNLCFTYRVKSNQPTVKTTASESCNKPTWFCNFSPLFFFFITTFKKKTNFLCLVDMTYTITLDSLRATSRASFISKDLKNDRRTTQKFTIMDGTKECMEKTFMMSASCVFLPVQSLTLFSVCIY